MKKLIHSGFYHQAKQYAYEQKWQPRDWAFIDGRERMMGLSPDTEMHVVGQFYLHPHSHEILQEARIRRFKIINDPYEDNKTDVEVECANKI